MHSGVLSFKHGFQLCFVHASHELFHLFLSSASCVHACLIACLVHLCLSSTIFIYILDLLFLCYFSSMFLTCLSSAIFHLCSYQASSVVVASIACTCRSLVISAPPDTPVKLCTWVCCHFRMVSNYVLYTLLVSYFTYAYHLLVVYMRA